MSKINEYFLGTKVRISIVVTDITGAYIDPSHLEIDWHSALTGPITTLVYGVDSSVIRTGTGYYYVEIVPIVGNELCYYTVSTSGNVQVTKQNKFFVKTPL